MSRRGNFGFIAEGCMVGTLIFNQMHMKKVKNMFLRPVENQMNSLGGR